MRAFPWWVGLYIGRPYAECDCWTLIQTIYHEQFGLVIPEAPGGSDPLAGGNLWAAEMARWQLIPPGQEQQGDILAFQHPRLGWHAALVIEPPYMLHTEPTLDSVWERYDRSGWERQCMGIYRHASRHAHDDSMPGL
jgi:cell wall-associated NlpC family hydrolase